MITQEFSGLNEPADKQKEPETPRSGFRAGAWLALLLVLIVAGFAIVSGLRVRADASKALVTATDTAAIPVVNTVHPTASAPIQEIVLPGNLQAFTESAIYARTNGYVKKWYFDLGSRVKKGDLLAEIETPEVDQQLQQAKADLETARANLQLAQTTAERWQVLLKTNAVSKQETDQAVANLAALKATAASREANVHQLEELQSFEKVYAPFDGVITARNIDTGNLISAGSGTTARELFHLAGISQVRVFIPVPEVYSNAAQPGAMVNLSLDEFPGRLFGGKLVRNSNTIDPASRTLLVEADVDNPAGLLLPGAYVSVHLKLPRQIRSVTVPANTLLFRSEGLRVGVVHEGHAELLPVTIGRDYGATVEIVSGLSTGDSVILDPSDSLLNGAPVRAGVQHQDGPAK